MIRSFLKDYRDQGASVRSGLQAIDVLAALSLALAVSIQFVGQLNQLLTRVAHVSPTVLNLAIGGIGAVWAGAVIRARTVPEQAADASPYLLRPRAAYRFGRPARLIAKLLFPVLLIYTGAQAYRLGADAGPLPGSIYGYLVDETNRPRPGLRVEVVSSRGERLARSRYETDDLGFYVVRASRGIPRSARLRVVDALAECGNGDLLPLAKANQLRAQARPASLSPGEVVFRHVVSCPSAS